jgi:hypothetical protein
MTRLEESAELGGLLRRQDTLQAEATRVLADLALFDLLGPFGEVTQVGSSAVGLMVRSDIDLCVDCDPARWNPDAVFAAARPLASHPRVQKLSFWNESGPFKPPGLADGLYWGVRYLSDAAGEWNLDVWFWPRDATGGPPPDVAHAADLRRRLDPETRAAILLIKDAHHRDDAFVGHEVRSIDVYEAVLDRGVRTVAEFGSDLTARGAAGHED